MMMSKNSYFNKTFFKNLMKRFWIIGLGMMVSYVLLYLYPIYQGASSEGYQYYAAYLKGSYFTGNLIISTIAVLTSVALLYFYHNRTALQLFILCLLKDQNSIGHLLLQG